MVIRKTDTIDEPQEEHHLSKFKVQQINNALVAKHYTPMYLMHKFWARKSPNVVSEYIKHYSRENEIVLDPFAGSGVTAIEALKLQRKAVCIDYNPVMIFIARMTGAPINLRELRKQYEMIVENIRNEILGLYKSKCPKCGKTATIIGTKWELKKNRPLEIRLDCQVCEKRVKKKPDDNDLKNIERIEQMK